MRKLILVLIFSLSAAGVHAGERGTFLWLGPVSDASRAAWAQEGFTVAAHDCADPSCILDAARADLDKPVILVAANGQTDLVRALYDGGLSRADIEGTLIFRPAPAAVTGPADATDTPPLLVLAQGNDPQDRIVAARQFVDAVNRAGGKAAFLFAEADGIGEGTLDRMTMDIVLTFTGHSPFGPAARQLMQADLRWQTPLLDDGGFRALPDLVARHPMDAALKSTFETFFRFNPLLMKQWRFDSYEAFDLLAYRDRVAPGARYVTLRNRRGQVFVFDLETYGAYEPVIVIGVDDTVNMNRFVYFYRTKAMYSWQEGTPALSVQPLGPLLHFRKPPADTLAVSWHLRNLLSLDGMTFSETDPFAEAAAYPEAVRDILVRDNNCLNCHAAGPSDARAFHLTALTAEPQGGFALPLVDYPAEVMDAFIDEQEMVAEVIGMVPNPIAPEARDAIKAWIAARRDQQPGAN